MSTATASLKASVTSTALPSVHCPSVPASLTVGVLVTIGGSTSICPDAHAPVTLLEESVISTHNEFGVPTRFARFGKKRSGLSTSSSTCASLAPVDVHTACVRFQ